MRHALVCLALLAGALACERAQSAAPDERPPVARPATQPTAPEPTATQPTATQPTATQPTAARPGAGATAAPGSNTTFVPPDADGWGRAGSLRYLERVHGGAGREAPLPLVVMIHGLGDRPRRDWLQELPVPARVILPQAPDPYHGGFAWFAYRVGDNDPEALARGIARAAQRLAESIAILQRERPTRGKPIVSGFSQGGMLSYALALHHGALLSLALPIAGMLPRPLWPDTRGPAPPIRALHGDSDPIVPHRPADALVRHLSALGYDARLELFEGVGHSVSPAVGVRMTETLVEGIGAAQRAPEL